MVSKQASMARNSLLKAGIVNVSLQPHLPGCSIYGMAFHPYRSQSKDVSREERITIAPRSVIPALSSVFEISIKFPTHRWIFSKHCPLSICSFMSQENDQPSIGLCFLGVLWDNAIMNSKLSWCQSPVTQAWHLGVWCFYSEQLCKFGMTFQFEDPLTHA